MGGMNFFLFILIFLLVYLSLRARVRRQMFRETAPLPEFKTSYLSQAITDLVATAGGIYIAIFLLVNFLQIPMPSRVSWGSVSMEPVAALSFLIALLQPLVARWWQGRGHG